VTNYLAPEQSPTRDELDGTTGPVLLEFGTEWCGYCRALAPTVDELLRAHPEIRHVKVEDGAGLPLGRSFRVKLWPNYVLLRDGQVIAQLARPGRQELRDAVAALVGG
jgi:thioredoxin 1